jgi:uracil-DNA glycosylase
MESPRLSPTFVGPTGFKPCTYYFVGEAPGATEDREKKPFVGRSGQLLRRALGEARYDWGTVRMWNVCFYRPTMFNHQTGMSRNRKPSEKEIGDCFGALRQDIMDSRPRIIVCLGQTAYKHICYPPPAKYSEVRGRMIIGSSFPFPITVQYHPSYILREEPNENGPEYREYVEAFRQLRKNIETAP